MVITTEKYCLAVKGLLFHVTVVAFAMPLAECAKILLLCMQTYMQAYMHAVFYHFFERPRECLLSQINNLNYLAARYIIKRLVFQFAFTFRFTFDLKNISNSFIINSLPNYPSHHYPCHIVQIHRYPALQRAIVQQFGSTISNMVATFWWHGSKF